MSDLISRQAAIDAFNTNIDELVVSGKENADEVERYLNRVIDEIKKLPPIQPEIVRCKDCKHNPKYEWFGCPMCHLSEKQRPETAWCWKAERRTDGSDRQTGGDFCNM